MTAGYSIPKDALENPFARALIKDEPLVYDTEHTPLIDRQAQLCLLCEKWLKRDKQVLNECVDLTPTLTIPAGETLHVRILPWHDYAEVKDSKYIVLRNVSIEGMAFEPGPGPEGIEQTFSESSNPQIRKFIKDGMLVIEKNGKFYNAQGVEVR